jgi:hypothetical protein
VGGDPHPDRDAWPGYWRGIRKAGVWLAVIIVIVGGGTLLPRPDDQVPRVAVDVAIGLLAAVVATFLASRVEAWWGERHP